jgi:hypothetical protein
MYHDTGRPLTLEGMLRDPLTRQVMEADGVTVAEFAAVLYAARDAVASRGQPIARTAPAGRLAMLLPP